MQTYDQRLAMMIGRVMMENLKLVMTLEEQAEVAARQAAQTVKSKPKARKAPKK